MEPLKTAIDKAVTDQYPVGQPNDFQIIYGTAKKKSDRERWTEHFQLQLKSHGFILHPVNSYDELLDGDTLTWRDVYPEFRFHPLRRWLMDFAIPVKKIHIEIEGGIWMGGRGAHSRPMNIQRDIEKQNAAVLLGWRPLRFSPTEIKSGESIRATIELATR